MRRKTLHITQKWMVAVVVIGVGFVGMALAHHGWSEYDQDKTLNLTGVIREYGYDNPHGLVRLETQGEGAKTWLVVLAPPARMEGRGLKREMLKEGTTATVVGYPHRTKTEEMRAERITIGEKTTELR